jgi:putative membrane protein
MIIRWVINAVALYAAIALVPGLQPTNPNWQTYVWLALIFGLVNALVRPILKFLTCPLIILTLGLFTLVVNTLLFYITDMIGDLFSVGLQPFDFWAAFLGALVVSIISVILTSIIKDDDKPVVRKTPS